MSHEKGIEAAARVLSAQKWDDPNGERWQSWAPETRSIIAAYLAEAQPGGAVAGALDFEGVAGFLSDLMGDVRNGHTFSAKEQAEILINLACEPLRRGRPIRALPAAQPTSEGEEQVDRDSRTTDMRSAFEAAHVLTDLNLTWMGDRYLSDSTERCWWTWQAAARSSREGGKW